MGGSLAHEFMVLNEHGEDTLVLCDACGYAANQQIATVAKPEPPAEEPRPTEEVATPEADTIASPGRPPGGRHRPHGQGHVLRDRRRADGDRHRAWRLRGQRDQARRTRCKAVGGLRPAHPEEITAAGMEPGLRLPHRRARHGGGRRRPRRPLTEPGGRREPPRLPPAEREPRPRLHRRPGGGHRQRPRGRPVPPMRAAARPAPRDRGRATSSSSGPTSPRRWARPTWPRTAAGSW